MKIKLLNYKKNLSNGSKFSDGHESNLDGKGLAGWNDAFEGIDADLLAFLLVVEFELEVEGH